MPPAANVKVTLWGDWGRAQRFFNGFVYRLRSAVYRGSKEDAEAFLRRMRANIYSQRYAQEWPPLGKWRNSPRKVDPRLLLNTHEYIQSMQVVNVGRGGWAVGVLDPKQAVKGLVHEYGGMAGSTGYPIPARPHWRVELERLKRGLKSGGLAKALEAVLRDDRGSGLRLRGGDEGEE